jgi:hypothetical protein
MGFSYTPDDLKKWLRADPLHGPKWKFVLDKMSGLGHTLEIERLIGRDFNGTTSRAVVSTGARNQSEATQWAQDAIREWAGNGSTKFTSQYFLDIARAWAAEGPGKGHTARCLGSTLDFLTLLSSAGSNDSSFDMLPASSSVCNDVARDQKVLNRGDYDLGGMAARWGESFDAHPRFIGGLVEQELLGEDPASLGLYKGKQ